MGQKFGPATDSTVDVVLPISIKVGYLERCALTVNTTSASDLFSMIEAWEAAAAINGRCFRVPLTVSYLPRFKRHVFEIRCLERRSAFPREKTLILKLSTAICIRAGKQGTWGGLGSFNRLSVHMTDDSLSGGAYDAST